MEEKGYPEQCRLFNSSNIAPLRTVHLLKIDLHPPVTSRRNVFVRLPLVRSSRIKQTVNIFGTGLEDCCSANDECMLSSSLGKSSSFYLES